MTDVTYIILYCNFYDTTKITISTPKTSSPHQNPPHPHPPQHIKLESKTPSANGKTRISPHTFSWRKPGKSPSMLPSPAALLNFRPLDQYFVWKNPLYRCVSTYLYVLKKKTGGKSPSVSK